MSTKVLGKVGQVGRWFIPGKQTAEDGREKWPSRAAFIMAGMGSAVGLGNLLRYPSQVFANFGLQWFIPYLGALFFIGIPILLLEIALGQTYRNGSVPALGRISPRLKGIGFGSVYISYVVACYYNPILAWVMVYLRNSVLNPIPWAGKSEEFLAEQVIRNPPPIENSDGVAVSFSTGMVWETFGWNIFIWFLVYLSLFKGVSLTGKVVYFTMLAPLIMMITITIRAVMLPNAWEGIKLYIAVFEGSKLADGKIWVDAIGQIFFSIGTGFGIYTAFASYNSQFSNGVQDAIIIAGCNSAFEMVAGFAAFSIIGNLNIELDRELSTFTLAFYTYPEVLATLPGANVWAFVFFLMLLLLGVDSAFSMVEVMVTLIADNKYFKHIPRPLLTFFACFIGFLCSIIYCTEFGEEVLNQVDKYITQLSLVFVAYMECVALNSIYRWKDVAGQVGFKALALFNATYLASHLLGAILYHTIGLGVAVGGWIGLCTLGMIVSTVIAKRPTIVGSFGENVLVNKFWWLSCYSGLQLTRDLNVHVAQGNNWRIPIIWAPLLRWFTAPVLMFILSQAFPGLSENAANPLVVFGFIVGLVVPIVGFANLVFTRFLNPLLPPGEEHKWKEQYSTGPNETVGAILPGSEKGKY